MAVQSIFATQRHCLLSHQNRPCMVWFTLNYAWGLGSGHSSSTRYLSRTEEAIGGSNTRDQGWKAQTNVMHQSKRTHQSEVIMLSTAVVPLRVRSKGELSSSASVKSKAFLNTCTNMQHWNSCTEKRCQRTVDSCAQKRGFSSYCRICDIAFLWRQPPDCTKDCGLSPTAWMTDFTSSLCMTLLLSTCTQSPQSSKVVRATLHHGCWKACWQRKLGQVCSMMYSQLSAATT